MNKIETCFICKLGINTFKDNFSRITDFIEGEKDRSLFVHKQCWLEHMSNKALMIKSQNQLNKIMKKLIN